MIAYILQLLLELLKEYLLFLLYITCHLRFLEFFDLQYMYREKLIKMQAFNCFMNLGFISS